LKKLCAICGENEATTKDHIPPQGLYPKPRANNLRLNTVPACAQCNNGASVVDEEFKVLIRFSTGEHQRNPLVALDSIARTVGKNQKIANQIFSTKRDIWAKLKDGTVKPMVSISFDKQKYDSVIQRISRGLHWMETGKAISNNAKLTVVQGSVMEQSLAEYMMDIMMKLPLKKLNMDTFTYRFQIVDEKLSIWGMQFFGENTVFVFVSDES
jgi:hypothetical protein